MDKYSIFKNAFNSLRSSGIIHTQRDFANLLGVNEGTISKALRGDESYLTEILMSKVSKLMNEKGGAVPSAWVQEFTSLDSVPTLPKEASETLLVIPVEAMGGTLGDFSESVQAYECERMVSPVKGADYAMKVSGDSMSPEYPNGCQILIKKINEKAFIEWGKVYVLDTDNGAVIKKIRKTSKDNVIECVSINADYQPFTIDTSFIHGWYRVLMVMSFK